MTPRLVMVPVEGRGGGGGGGEEATNHFALLEFEKPVTCLHDSSSDWLSA